MTQRFTQPPFLRIQLMAIAGLHMLYSLTLSPAVFWSGISVYLVFLALDIAAKRFEFVNLVLVFLSILVASRVPVLKYWSLVSGFVIYLVLSISIPRLRSNQGWLRLGSFDKKTFGYLIVTIVLSGAVLIVWYIAAAPDLSPMTSALVSLPVWIRAAAVILFAVINAVTEESIFDGIMFHTGESVFQKASLVILFPALSYGFAHYRGIPSGAGGVLLSFLYGGLMLGVLRFKTGGILMPIIAHIVADLVIAILAFAL